VQDELLGQLQADATGCAGHKRQTFGFCHAPRTTHADCWPTCQCARFQAEDEPDTQTPRATDQLA